MREGSTRNNINITAQHTCSSSHLPACGIVDAPATRATARQTLRAKRKRRKEARAQTADVAFSVVNRFCWSGNSPPVALTPAADLRAMDKPQIIEHVQKSINYTVFTAKWVPSSSRIVALGSHPRGTGLAQDAIRFRPLTVARRLSDI